MDLGSLMGRGVVDHYLDVEIFGDGAVDEVQEAPELKGMVAWVTSEMAWPEAMPSAAWYVTPPGPTHCGWLTSPAGRRCRASSTSTFCFMSKSPWSGRRQHGSWIPPPL
jgi:hypothetical protein